MPTLLSVISYPNLYGQEYKPRILTSTFTSLVISAKRFERYSLHTGPGTHPATYTMGTESPSRGLKRPGRGENHPPPPIQKWG
jgi:hypothetical protein